MISASSCSLVFPTRRRRPSYVRISNSSTLSAVFPPITECTPHELLPIIPPSVQWLCVEGSGANIKPCCLAASCNESKMTPGSTWAVRVSGSRLTTRFMYFDVSRTTATLQHWPAKLVPPPRARMGAPKLRAISTVIITSSVSRGMTTPIGTWR